MSTEAKLVPIRRPKVWKYLLVAVLLYLVLAPLMTALDVLLIHPKILSQPETAMDRLRWIVAPFLVVAFFLGGRFLDATRQAYAHENKLRLIELQEKRAKSQAMIAKEHREYVLEIMGLGVTVDKYRQGKLWDALKKDNPYNSIREQDPKKYAWTGDDKLGVSGGRISDAFENGVKPTPMFWGGPSFNAGPPDLDTTDPASPINPVMGVAGDRQSTGMWWHLFINGPWLLSERPDRILEQVFEFFDSHPDVPYVVVEADDGLSTRDGQRAKNTPSLARDGYYIPEMTDASAAFVLARRERVEPLRDYVWDDPDNNFVQNEFRQMYYNLMDTVPTDKRRDSGNVHYGRQPTIEEWLPAAAAFAKTLEAHPEGHRKYFINFPPYKNSPSKKWKPTPWFPIPWNSEQMKAFDDLPSLGFLHRPTFVKFTDAEGHPIKRSEQRLQVLTDGWQQALLSLSDAERGAGPTRVIAATNNNTDQLTALTTMLYHYGAAGGPEIDIGKTEHFINTDRRLGNTGAATFFVQMALGVMGSYLEGGVSAAINLRDPNEASIIFISPPSDESRKSQPYRFKHYAEPAIDPKNYETPSVEALMEAQRQHASQKTGASAQQGTNGKR